MIIGVDVRVLLDAQYSGVAEYTLNLLRALSQEDKVNDYVLFYNSAKNLTSRLPEFDALNVNFVNRRWSNKLLNYGFFKFLDWPQIDKLMGKKLDVFWLPHINFVALPQAKNVLTVHDLSFLRYGEFFSARQNFWHRQLNIPKLIKQVDCLAAISENTKRDIIDLIDLKEDKITVVYSGVSADYHCLNNDDERLKEIKQKYQLPNRFILSVGTIEPRKNLNGLIKAYNYLRRNYSALAEVELIIAGGNGWKFKEVYKTAKNSPYYQDIKFLGYIDRQDKCPLYNSASVLAFPSFYEGFGFPPLEAMSCGTPVVATFASSIPEVVGQAGILVDPYNATEIGEALAQVLLNKNLAESLRQAGLIKAKEFTWQKTAQEYLKLFFQ